jgi:acetylornithine deacetylase/succinyl-diaminopimelate desuccinylase-like protein
VKGAALRSLDQPFLAQAALAALPAELANPLRSLLTDTASPTRFSGSEAVNVVPRRIVVDLDVRTLPGSSVEAFLSDLRGRLGEPLECEVLETSPAVVSRADSPVFQHLAKTVRRHDPSCRPVPFMIPGFTDARHFSRLGMDCYGFAPLALEPKDAAELKSRVHGVDERVPKEAFLKGYMILEDAVLSYIT